MLLLTFVFRFGAHRNRFYVQKPFKYFYGIVEITTRCRIFDFRFILRNYVRKRNHLIYFKLIQRSWPFIGFDFSSKPRITRLRFNILLFDKSYNYTPRFFRWPTRQEFFHLSRFCLANYEKQRPQLEYTPFRRTLASLLNFTVLILCSNCMT